MASIISIVDLIIDKDLRPGRYFIIYDDSYVVYKFPQARGSLFEYSSDI